MPDITAAGTYTKDTPGFEFLKASPRPRTFLFAGAAPGDAISIQYTDDMAMDHEIENGNSTAVPWSPYIRRANTDLKIVVTGTPNFNVTEG